MVPARGRRSRTSSELRRTWRTSSRSSRCWTTIHDRHEREGSKPMTMVAEQHHGVDIHQLLRVAMRRKMLLLVPWGIALALGIAAAVLLPPVYFSSVTLLLERPQTLSGSLSNMVNPFNPDRQADIM